MILMSFVIPVLMLCLVFLYIILLRQFFMIKSKLPVFGFKGAMGGLNCSKSLAELLIRQAPLVSRRVDEELMPKWFRQRGVDVSLLEKLRG